MYAKIDSTTWDWQSPTRSSLKGCDREFDHEMDCPRHERMDKDCDCYVSRIRLVKTPVGEFIPTTEPDPRSDPRYCLREDVTYWRERSYRVQRENNILWVALGLTSIGHLVLALI